MMLDLKTEKYESHSPLKQSKSLPKNDHRESSEKSSSQHIIIKNIDSGSYEVFNVQEVDSVDELKQSKSAQTRISLWNSYWDEISKTDVKLLRLIMRRDASKLQKILTEEPIELNTFRYIDGWTLLHHAVVSSSQQIVSILIDHKINVNIVSDQMKRTALHEAVLSNKINIVGLLIQNDADPNIQDADGNTAVHYSAELSYEEIFEIIMQSQIRINFKLKNNQQMTILDCIRDEKMYKFVEEKYPQTRNLNQIQHQGLENRRVVKLQGGVTIKRFSKSDMIEKFLILKSPQYHHQSEQIKAKMKSSVESNASSEGKGKHNLLGKRPSHWIQKKGQLIASQSICLMKQSVLNIQEKQNQNEESLANYDILRFIGSGGFAEVFLARRKKSSKLFALKRINKSQILQNNLKRYVYSERNIMIKCHHPFIVEAYSMFQDQAHLYIAMEYCQCGDLRKIISQKGNFPQKQAQIYAAQVGLALQYMHSKNILFRDLKAANVLVGKDGYVKVSDFGLAKQTMISFTFLGSLQYLAPEMVVDSEMKQHTKSIDWYLYGVFIYEIVTGKPPFYSEKQQTMFKKIKQQKPTFPSYLTKQCKNLLSKLLQKDPSKRLGSLNDFSQIKSDQWFRQIDFQKLTKKQYQVYQVAPTIKQSDLRKKIPIDSFVAQEKHQYFKQWNYVKSV